MKTTLAAVLAVSVFIMGCGPQDAIVDDVYDDEAEAGQELIDGLRGRPLGLDVAQWNVMWLGNTEFGPTNETDQNERVGALIKSANVDLWALTEVSNQASFDQLVARVPGYAGLAATDPRVAGGTASYSIQEQRPALLYKTRAISVRTARLILTDQASTFAGRPPLEAELSVTINRKTLDLTVIVVHLKAGPGLDDRARRLRASELLETHVKTLSGEVLVIGDWNDATTRSIASGQTSPFTNWSDSGLTWLTQPLEEQGQKSSIFGSFIDHAIATPGLLGKRDSTTVTDPRPTIPNYANTTSDHFPVLHLFSL
ncbi:MAG: endonuclease/exonuclease/phosphatase family protein [Archangium sp.]|nr:endonuclease/exonuclease/phosphatase family protein [Archangium sp.]